MPDWSVSRTCSQLVHTFKDQIVLEGILKAELGSYPVLNRLVSSLVSRRCIVLVLHAVELNGKGHVWIICERVWDLDLRVLLDDPLLDDGPLSVGEHVLQL